MKAFGIIFLFFAFTQASLPESVKRCKIDDEKCQINTINEIITKNNFQTLSLPSVDPLLVEKMDIEQGGNHSVQISLKLRKVNLYGLMDAKVYKISGFEKDPEKNKLEIKFKTPLGTIEGPYTINGKILVLPIQGRGNITLALNNLDITLRYLTKKVVKDGKTYMQIEKSKFRYNVTGAKVNFTNLFNGDKALGDNMNSFLNANWQILLDELNKPITDAFGQIFREFVSTVVNSTPYDDLFLH